ncbi:Cilia- and flagella-associated protein 44 [Bulinus truncatus]|nr:Cilia- and flagella-associated protein 44 [Bulinus truncatus]
MDENDSSEMNSIGVAPEADLKDDVVIKEGNDNLKVADVENEKNQVDNNDENVEAEVEEADNEEIVKAEVEQVDNNDENLEDEVEQVDNIEESVDAEVEQVDNIEDNVDAEVEQVDNIEDNVNAEVEQVDNIEENVKVEVEQVDNNEENVEAEVSEKSEKINNEETSDEDPTSLEDQKMTALQATVEGNLEDQHGIETSDINEHNVAPVLSSDENETRTLPENNEENLSKLTEEGLIKNEEELDKERDNVNESEDVEDISNIQNTDEVQEESDNLDTEKSGEEEIITVTSRRKDNQDEELIPADFYYNFQELASKPKVTEESGLPVNVLHLKHSYGYDCKRRNNLHLLDENHVVFAAGNLVQIVNLKSKEQNYLRSISGCGIGAICVHPSHKYFAVGEKGHSPSINIFEFPSLKLYRILRGGTEESYSSLTFSPDGELLASQGGDPDFMLTLWNWRQEKTTLRTKSFSQDVFRVSFAPELEGQLTTAGIGHIRFWKMADTFTGLKLQGELGRFGRTEISDIEGYVELPDGKVLSGAEWGNLLLWEGGLIKVEITCKGKKNCHQGPIMQILLDEGELMTVGADGYIRVWDFETIDTADATDDSGKFEMDPMNEMKVGSDVQLYSIVKSIDEENEPTIWYAQDANGGIWKLDLSFSHTSQTPEKLFTYHAGPISSCVTSPVTHLAVSTGLDSTVRVYDYIQMKQLAEAKFTSGGTAISWVPISVDPKGGSVVVGFGDGVVRVLNISNKVDEENLRRQDKHEAEIALKQAFKPHKGKVTAMAFDGKGEVLATGSVDGTVFFLYVGDVYDPIGFIKVPGPVRQLVWTPEKFKKAAVMVVCEDGVVVEVESPEPGNFDTSHSYEISGLSMKTYKFKSIKSYLRHEEELEKT